MCEGPPDAMVNDANAFLDVVRVVEQAIPATTLGDTTATIPRDAWVELCNLTVARRLNGYV